MKCEDCNTKLNYFALLESFWFGFKQVKCLRCDSIFEHTSFNRILGGIIVFISTLVSNMTYIGEKALLQTFFVMLLSMFISSLITPLIMKFKKIKTKIHEK